MHDESRDRQPDLVDVLLRRSAAAKDRLGATYSERAPEEFLAVVQRAHAHLAARRAGLRERDPIRQL
jgi:hypothetical protein